ncbi:MAG: histone deacetylase, partial [Candidatus Nanoarchaeia archaeon]
AMANVLIKGNNLYSNYWLQDVFNGDYNVGKRMLVGIVYSPIYLEPSLSDHVECRERLQGILEKLIVVGEEYFNWVDPIKPSESILQFVHNKNNDRHRDGTVWHNYLMDVKRASKIFEERQGQYDSSTGPSELRYESYDVALLSVGGVLRAVDYVLKEPAKSAVSAWSLGRPPGHLANNKICIFNNIAIGAHYAMRRYNIHRILIVDCDAHHGKHTAYVFRSDPNVLYFSMHIEGDYAKEEGTVDVIGDGEGKGYTFNLQYPKNMDDDGYIYMIDGLLIPVAKEFAPELIMISAGFDGHFEDDLTPGCILTERAYIHLAKKLKELASSFNIKIVGALEGGYGLESMVNSFVHMINIIGDWKVPEDKIGFVKGSENRKISPDAFKRVKEEVKTRVRLMKQTKEENSTGYRLFSDIDHWNKILNAEL